jgi:hypothetical protein
MNSHFIPAPPVMEADETKILSEQCITCARIMRTHRMGTADNPDNLTGG